MKASLSKNPIIARKFQFTITGFGLLVVTTRAAFTLEQDSIERVDKTVVPTGILNAFDFDITIPAGEQDSYDIMILWAFGECMDRGQNIPTGSPIGLSPGYKRTGIMKNHHSYEEAGSRPMEWELIGLWPKSIEIPENSWESTDESMLNVTLSCDNARPLNAQNNLLSLLTG